MKWIRKHPREAIAGLAMAIGVITILVTLLNSGSDDNTASSPRTTATGIPYVGGEDPVVPETSSGTPGTNPLVPSAAAATAPVDPAQGLKGFGGGLSLPGLQGSGGTKGLSKHRVTVRLTSKAPIPGVGYIIPTSLDKYYGTEKNIGTSWSLTTFAYGDPAYAQLFSQAAARGYPITCTITVDGKVTEQRSTDGPYGQLYCQG